MNQLVRMNTRTYAEHWAAESTRFEQRGLYADLSTIAPKQRSLEIGSGSGLSTKHIASDRKVLGLDNNPHLLRMARANNAGNPDAEFMETDIFNLSPDHVRRIMDFSPKGIIAWMIGSDLDTVDSRVLANVQPQERPKLYREAVEDLLVLEPLCSHSVEWIHMAHRVGLDSQATDRHIKEEMVKDYEGYMLKGSDFRVSRVDILDWKRGPDEFMYVSAANQNFKAQDVRSCIVSLVASRRPRG